MEISYTLSNDATCMFTTADVMWMAVGSLQLRRFYHLVLFQTHISEFHIGDAA